MRGYVVGVGAANVDIHCQSKNAVVLRDSNPGHMRTSAGGVTRNVLENLARQGESVRLVSAVGDDLFGDFIRSHSRSVGIDDGNVLTVAGERSSCYVQLLDDGGDMLVAMSDMSILRHITPEYLRERADVIRSAAAIVCDGCLPTGSLEALLALAGDTPVFLDPVSTAYAKAVRPLAGKFFCLKPNRMELSELTGMPAGTETEIEAAADKLLSLGCGSVAVSLGERGAYYADALGERMFRSLRPLGHMANAAGAGDAFMSGLVRGYLAGTDTETRLYYALACGRIAAAGEETISPSMSEAAVIHEMNTYIS